MANDSITVNNTRAAAVNQEVFWIDITVTPPPLGVKLQLINQALGVATYSNYTKGAGWTHWQALPKFR